MTDVALCKACRRPIDWHKSRGILKPRAWLNGHRPGLCAPCSIAFDAQDLRSLFAALLIYQREQRGTDEERALACYRQVKGLLIDLAVNTRGKNVAPDRAYLEEDDYREVIRAASGAALLIANVAKIDSGSLFVPDDPDDWLELFDGKGEGT